MALSRKPSRRPPQHAAGGASAGPAATPLRDRPGRHSGEPMMHAKPAAALASGLLARKGDAVPTSLVVLPAMARAHASEITPGSAALRGVLGGKPPHDGVDTAAAKLSLRLNGDRHRRLRLVALHL